ADGGRVVLLMDGHGGERLDDALAAEGLGVARRLSIHPRPGTPPTFHVAVAQRGRRGAVEPEPLTMRGALGPGWSPWYAALRDRLDLP
ncbi:MAG: hypothetical protein KC613_26295, partial [Myxococcales bacterium]|nr:hypothetical protein [Myxococcales bacterium]